MGNQSRGVSDNQDGSFPSSDCCRGRPQLRYHYGNSELSCVAEDCGGNFVGYMGSFLLALGIDRCF